eukprot:Em0011g45a
MNTHSLFIFALVCSSLRGAFSKCPRQSLSSEYRLINALPAGCDPSNCDYYLGIRTNDEDPEFLDFMMVGKAQGWIAIGFSLKPDMEDADVLACALHPSTQTPVILDAYNIPNDHENIRDTIQNMCPHTANFSNGRITCTFSRAINTGDPQDKDLNGDYYEQFAAVDKPAAIVSGNVTLTYHGSQTPLISKSTVNPATTNGSVSSSSPLRVILTRVHGILMVVAWPVLAVTGIFFAAWMKPVLRNGWWFQVHRAIMMLSLFTAGVGFLVIFVANKDYTIPGLIPLKRPLNIAHFVMGILVMLFHIVNTWIFNVLHGTRQVDVEIGKPLHMCRYLVNCGLGVALFEDIFAQIAGGHTLLWVYLGFVSFIFVLVAVCGDVQDEGRREGLIADTIEESTSPSIWCDDRTPKCDGFYDGCHGITVGHQLAMRLLR